MEKLDAFYGLFIDGEFTESSDKARFKTYSPATGELLSEVAEATKEGGSGQPCKDSFRHCRPD